MHRLVDNAAMTRRLYAPLILIATVCSPLVRPALASRGGATAEKTARGMSVVVLDVWSSTETASTHDRLSSQLRHEVGAATGGVIVDEEMLLQRARAAADLRSHIDQAERAFASGREAHVNLNLARAVVLYRRALAAQHGAAFACYRPEAVAEIYIQLGAALADTNHPDNADATLGHAARLAPWLELDPGTHSPSLRERYARVRPQARDPIPGRCAGTALGVLHRLGNATLLVMSRLEGTAERRRIQVRLLELPSGTLLAEGSAATAPNTSDQSGAIASAVHSAFALLPTSSASAPTTPPSTEAEGWAEALQPEGAMAPTPPRRGESAPAEPGARAEADRPVGDTMVGATVGAGVSLLEPTMTEVRALHLSLGARPHPRWTLSLGSGLGVDVATAAALLSAADYPDALADLYLWRVPLGFAARFDLLTGDIRPHVLLGATLALLYLTADEVGEVATSASQTRLIDSDSWGIGLAVHTGLGVSVSLTGPWSVTAGTTYAFAKHFYANPLRWDVIDGEREAASRTSIESAPLQDRHRLTLFAGVEVRL